MSKMVDSQPQESSDNEQFGSKAKSGLSQSLSRLWDGVIDLSLANIPLLACCFITGLLDTTMFQGEQSSGNNSFS